MELLLLLIIQMLIQRWEPQYLLYKRTSAAEQWRIVDSQRGWVNGSGSLELFAQSTAAESTGTPPTLSATGFYGNTGLNSSTYIYLAIRRPNKPPTTGTQVYNAVSRAGTNAAATVSAGFAPDLLICFDRTGNREPTFVDKLRGGDRQLYAESTSLEQTTGAVAFTNDGVYFYGMVSTNINNNGFSEVYINWFLRRTIGVFDEVCYNGVTGSALNIPHSLGVAPELMIVKSRSDANDGRVYAAPLGNTKYLSLFSVSGNTNGSAATESTWNNTTPTSSVFTVGSGNAAVNNGSSSTYVAWLFSTKAGISKVGSYTGNGSSQTINCGFTTGARFILIKRSDSSGAWFIWDTVRGIVASNDPHLSLNSAAAEVTTDDSIDLDSSGFIVNQVAATNINVTSATYIYLAFA